MSIERKSFNVKKRVTYPVASASGGWREQAFLLDVYGQQLPQKQKGASPRSPLYHHRVDPLLAEVGVALLA